MEYYAVLRKKSGYPKMGNGTVFVSPNNSTDHTHSKLHSQGSDVPDAITEA
jgi:hypothetical protein